MTLGVATGQPTGSELRIWVERRWRAMGTDAHLIAVDVVTEERTTAGNRRLQQLADRAVNRLSKLESLWSRFVPSSEISTLNRLGCATVSPETFALVERAILAWRATGGRFDPTQLRTLEHLGYDRSIEHVGGHDRPADGQGRPVSPSRALDAGAARREGIDGYAGIVLDRFTRTIGLPMVAHKPCDGMTAVAFDPGGIGKGLAADLVVEELLAAGAAGAMVNLGGDLRVEGRAPAGHGWVVEIGEQAWAPEPLAVVGLERGAVATSTPLRRRWSVAGDADAGSGTHHHLLDTGTGAPAVNGPAVVTAIAGEGWWAEAVATAVASRPATERFPDNTLERAATAVVDPDGAIRLSGGFEQFVQSMRLTTQAASASSEETRTWNR